MKSIDVVIPIYNRAIYLAHSLYLYTKQTYKDFNIIVVDDGSQDNIIDVVRFYKDRLNIKLFISHRKDHPCDRSGGPMVNFAMKNVSKADILLYADAEVMPFPNFVELHRDTHEEGYVLSTPPEMAPGCPIVVTDWRKEDVVLDSSPKYVKGMTLKVWKEFSHIFGTKEMLFRSGDLKDIETFWNRTWQTIYSLPNDLIGDPNKGYGYDNGEQHFWGFQGSQAGLSFDRKVAVDIGGWGEELDVEGKWMGEDGEIFAAGGRYEKAGGSKVLNANIRAAHIYHPKPPTYTDDERRQQILEKNADQNHKVANHGISWGDPDHLKIKEIVL